MPISWLGSRVQGVSTGGYSFTTTNISAEASNPVNKNTATDTPTILPALRRSPILATAPAMEANTIGTTMQNIKLINTVPSGFNLVAPGHTAPVIQPAATARSMAVIKP